MSLKPERKDFDLAHNPNDTAEVFFAWFAFLKSWFPTHEFARKAWIGFCHH
jgi:hypothetical protein